MKAFLAHLDTLDDDFSVFSAKRTPPEPEAIDEVERALGLPLSREHRELVEKLGCMAIVAKESVWPRPTPFAVRPLWQLCFGVEIFGLGAEQAPALDLLSQAKAYSPQAKKLVPAARVIGLPECVGYDAEGKLFAWAPGGQPTPLAHATLFDWLAERIDELSKNKDAIKTAPPRDAAGDDEAGVNELVAAWTEAPDDAARVLVLRDLADYESKLPPPAVALALAALKSPSLRDDALQLFDLDAYPEAVESLLSLLDAVKREPRWVHGVSFDRTCAALATCGEDDPRVVFVLAASLVVRERVHAALGAFNALRRLGDKARAAAPTLEGLLEDESPWLRVQARATLVAVTGELEPHVAEIVDMLDFQTESGDVKAAAQRALAHIGKRTLPWVYEAQKQHARARVRAAAAELVPALEKSRR